MKCPACHFEQPDDHTTCEACGLIFAKYQPMEISPREKWRQDREKLETPENGWTTHHVGSFTWKSTGWRTESAAGTTYLTGLSGVFLTLIILLMFLGFPFVFLWPRTVIPYYFTGIFSLFGFFLFTQSFTKLREKREMEDIPLSTIRAMAPGQVEISGTAAAAALLQAPFTHKSCVYYEYCIEKYVQQGKNSNWVTLERGGSRDQAFHLDDGTGKTAVHPGGADTIFAQSYRVETSRWKSIPSIITEFMESKGMSSQLTNLLRFTECTFEPGQTVFVMGVCQKKDDPAGGEGEVFVGKGSQPDDLFILSDKSRTAVERQFFLNALGSIFFGLALIAGSVYGFMKVFFH